MTRNEWNTFFENRKTKLLPEEFLTRNWELLKGPSILDIACGDGRNALFLACKKFKVTAVDFSEIALQKLEQEQNELITTVNMDLSNSDNLKQLSVFDSILINHFIPDNKVLVSLQDNLESGGVLMVVAFDERMTAIKAVPYDYILDFNSLELHLSKMSLIKKEEFRDERGFFRAAVLVRN